MDKKLKPKIWKEGDAWRCAIPENFFGLDWKTHGVQGIGNTPKNAYLDYKRAREIADLVNSIY